MFASHQEEKSKGKYEIPSQVPMMITPRIDKSREKSQGNKLSTPPSDFIPNLFKNDKDLSPRQAFSKNSL